MANSITGVNDDIIAQAALEAFVASILPLSAFTTSFSGEAAKKGEKVSVLRTIAADAAADKTTHAAYTIQDADNDAVEITLGQPKYVSWGLDDVEIASSSVVNMEVYGKQKGYELARAVLVDIFGAITNANYGAAVFTGAASTFDSDDVIDIATACDTAKMPPEMRALVLSETYAGALCKDNSIKSAANLGSAEVIREGSIGRLSGFDVFKSVLIPSNSENLVGFVAHPAGLAVAMRYLKPQEGNTYLRAEPLTDPSGITLGLRDWYDNSTGVRQRVLECVFGKITGIAAGIKRIVSA